MRALDTDLWVAESPLRFLGLELGARMTIVRLADGQLLLHSPIRATPELVGEVEDLGRVGYLIAPNRFHHLFLDGWQEARPEAKTYVAPGLEAKRSDIQIAGVLGEEPEPAWADSLDQVCLQGLPMTNEVVFFHRPSETLIATDLAFNIGSESPFATRLAFRLYGSYGHLTPTPVERVLVRDRQAFRMSLEQILDWPFHRVVVAHGEVLEHGGRDQLAAGYAWALL